MILKGSARSETSCTIVGAMTAATIERFADAHGPLRALVVARNGDSFMCLPMQTRTAQLCHPPTRLPPDTAIVPQGSRKRSNTAP